MNKYTPGIPLESWIKIAVQGAMAFYRTAERAACALEVSLEFITEKLAMYEQERLEMRKIDQEMREKEMGFRNKWQNVNKPHIAQAPTPISPEPANVPVKVRHKKVV